MALDKEEIEALPILLKYAARSRQDYPTARTIQDDDALVELLLAAKEEIERLRVMGRPSQLALFRAAAEHLNSMGACEDSPDDGTSSLCDGKDCTYCELWRRVADWSSIR